MQLLTAFCLAWKVIRGKPLKQLRAWVVFNAVISAICVPHIMQEKLCTQVSIIKIITLYMVQSNRRHNYYCIMYCILLSTTFLVVYFRSPFLHIQRCIVFGMKFSSHWLTIQLVSLNCSGTLLLKVHVPFKWNRNNNIKSSVPSFSLYYLQVFV